MPTPSDPLRDAVNDVVSRMANFDYDGTEPPHPGVVASWRDTLRMALVSQPEAAFDEADNMCPNCVTPWKCNGPHLSEQTVAANRAAIGEDAQRIDAPIAPTLDVSLLELAMREQFIDSGQGIIGRGFAQAVADEYNRAARFRETP